MEFFIALFGLVSAIIGLLSAYLTYLVAHKKHKETKLLIEKNRWSNNVDSVYQSTSFKKNNPFFRKLLIITSTIFLPPLGVFLYCGPKVSFWISFLLTLLGYIPGLVYAFFVITSN